MINNKYWIAIALEEARAWSWGISCEWTLWCRLWNRIFTFFWHSYVSGSWRLSWVCCCCCWSCAWLSGLWNCILTLFSLSSVLSRLSKGLNFFFEWTHFLLIVDDLLFLSLNLDILAFDLCILVSISCLKRLHSRQNLSHLFLKLSNYSQLGERSHWEKLACALDGNTLWSIHWHVHSNWLRE